MMREMSYVIAFFGAPPCSGRGLVEGCETEEEPIAGRVGIHSQRVKSAAKLTAIAFALSGLAAIVAVLGFFVRL